MLRLLFFFIRPVCFPWFHLVAMQRMLQLHPWKMAIKNTKFSAPASGHKQKPFWVEDGDGAFFFLCGIREPIRAVGDWQGGQHKLDFHITSPIFLFFFCCWPHCPSCVQPHVPTCGHFGSVGVKILYFTFPHDALRLGWPFGAAFFFCCWLVAGFSSINKKAPREWTGKGLAIMHRAKRKTRWFNEERQRERERETEKTSTVEAPSKCIYFPSDCSFVDC